MSIVGGVAGVMLAWWSLNLFLSVVFVRYGGGDMVRVAIDFTPDWRVLAYSFGLALSSGVAFGLVPALRATRHNLIGVVLRQGMKLALIGAAIGIPASLAAAPLLLSMLIGLTTSDALTIGAVTALLVGVTLLACYLPRAPRNTVDPLETLRYE